MEWKPGTVVRNAGGHDVGFFMVVSFDGKFVYIANGKSRLLEKPKKEKSQTSESHPHSSGYDQYHH